MGALSGRDVLRHDAQAASLRSNLLSKRRRTGRVKMTYAERVAETNGPIYKTGAKPKGRNGRVPSPPPKSPVALNPVSGPAFRPSTGRC